MGALKYSLKFFWPYVFFIGVNFLVFGIGGMINLMITGSLLVGFQMIGIGLFPIGLMLLSHRLALKAQKFRTIACLFYFTQLVLVSGGIGGLLVGLGGASMAAVENKMTRQQVFSQSTPDALIFLLWLQLFIAPWTVYSAKRFQSAK